MHWVTMNFWREQVDDAIAVVPGANLRCSVLTEEWKRADHVAPGCQYSLTLFDGTQIVRYVFKAVIVDHNVKAVIVV